VLAFDRIFVTGPRVLEMFSFKVTFVAFKWTIQGNSNSTLTKVAQFKAQPKTKCSFKNFDSGTPCIEPIIELSFTLFAKLFASAYTGKKC